MLIGSHPVHGRGGAGYVHGGGGRHPQSFYGLSPSAAGGALRSSSAATGADAEPPAPPRRMKTLSSPRGAMAPSGLRAAPQDADAPPRPLSRAKEMRDRGWQEGWLLVPELLDAGNAGDFAAWKGLVDLYEPAMSVRECVVGVERKVWGNAWKVWEAAELGGVRADTRRGWSLALTPPYRRSPLPYFPC